jgi:hypothetical protein
MPNPRNLSMNCATESILVVILYYCYSIFDGVKSVKFSGLPVV